MATKQKETAPAKEKRRASPSRVPQRRRSPNPAGSSDGNHDSSAPEKPIPNYLKPTKCSILEASKPIGKKIASTDSTSKSNVTRRRSFDKPQPTRTLKTRVSPNPILRSSSSPGKTRTSPKPTQDKPKGVKDGAKTRSLYARPVDTAKKSALKQETDATGSMTNEQVTDPPAAGDAPDVPVNETQQGDQESHSIKAEEETLNTAKDGQTGEQVLEDKEHPQMTQAEQQNNKDENNASLAEPAAGIEEKDVSVGYETEDHEDKPLIEEDKPHVEVDDSEHQKLEETTVNGEKSTDNDGTVEDNVKAEEVKDKDEAAKTEVEVNGEEAAKTEVEVEVKADEAANPEVEVKAEEATKADVEVKEGEAVKADIEVKTDKAAKAEVEVKAEEATNVEAKEGQEAKAEVETKEGEEKKADSGTETINPEETEAKEVTEEKHDAADTSSKRQGTDGKKDSAVSNDIIEETTTKLREQQVNKVKALAGAFQTVISLQDPK